MNIHGGYTLSESAILLGVSPAWINKIQERTGIVARSGVRGKRSSFSDADIKMLETVKCLRGLDFTTEEIRSIFVREKRMIKEMGHCNVPKDSEEDLFFIIHTYAIAEPKPVDDGGNSIKYYEKYEEDIKFIKSVSKEIERRMGKQGEEMASLSNKLFTNRQVTSRG